MNETMKIENIEIYIDPLDIEVGQKFVYRYTETGIMSSFTYGALAFFIDMQYYSLFFSLE